MLKNDPTRPADRLRSDLKVTIGVPFSHERVEDFILCIKSIFAQTYQGWELLLIADGARDDLVALANSISDPRVRVLNDGQQRGLAARLNQLASEAVGEYLVRMDADDVMTPDRVALSVACLDSRPDTDLLSTAAFLIDENAAVKGDMPRRVLSTKRLHLFLASPIIHPTVVTRTVWSRSNPYDEAFQKAQDKELWARAVTTNNYHYVECRTLFYRISTSITYDKHRRTNEYDRRIIRRYAPTQVGWWRTRVLLLRSHLKQAIFRMSTLAGLGALIYKKKSRPVESAQLKRAVRTLHDIRGSLVPGWTT